jgi:hypothetical protein
VVVSGGGTNLGAEAVSCSRDTGVSEPLEVLDALDDDAIDVFGRVRVLPIRPLRKPGHEVKAGRHVQGCGIAIEDVNDEAGEALRCEGVGFQLAVLPDADDVWDVEHGDVLLRGCIGC